MRIASLVLFAALVAAVPAQAAINGVAAVVNGEMITEFDLQNEVAPEAMRRQIDPKKPAQREAYDALTSATLERMINNIILTQEAQRLKISVSDSEVDNEMQQIMSRNKITPEEFQRQLQLQRMSEKDFRERVRSGVLRNRLLANMVGRKVIVTKEEVADYYNIHKQNFVNNQRVRFALIVYPPTENAEKQSARLRGGKASFEEVARKVSIGPRAQEGGDVGMVSWNTLDPAWQERLSLMEPGEISDLFEVNNGLKAQLKLIDMESGEGQTLEEATPQIERILREPKLQERFREYTEQLRKRAVVEIRR
ncbi:SurA N-terminal domain-containing protein [uncultured Bilophila sp.]|uniref:SurA N-terminal domain-containing protein n=3 Tax=uncultured Bilophila sp. TaxID=529385 RepID=UPI00262FA56D|nr:SurA N-terminal domain-containing protein [uncultured Bilophila sp.]